eukprot:3842750-Pleurochrysis_carterae.AAC.2
MVRQAAARATKQDANAAEKKARALPHELCAQAPNHVNHLHTPSPLQISASKLRANLADLH